MSTPVWFQTLVDERNATVDSVNAQVSDYNNIAKQYNDAADRGDYAVTDAFSSFFPERDAMLSQSQAKLADYDAKIPTLYETYADQYQEGVPLSKVTDYVDPSTLASPARPQPQPSNSGAMVPLSILALFFLFGGNS